MKNSAWSEETRRLGPAISEDFTGLRLDEYLADKFPFFSRSAWQKEIDRGVVFVNQSVARKSSQRLQLGDELCRLHPFDEEPSVDTHMPILWSDGELAALFKPSGLPMHEAGYYRRRTVAGILPQVLGKDWTAVHRLDRETSGLLLCARRASVRAQLTEMWTERVVHKTYFAVARGVPTEAEWIVNLPIKAERYVRTNRAEVSVLGDEAQTCFKLLSSGVNASAIEAKPLTGRTNQIRVHATACGLPLVGDKLYGADPTIIGEYRKEGNSPRVQAMAGFPRHALHAWKLNFTHPVNGEEISLESPIPDDLKNLCRESGIVGHWLESAQD